MFRKIPTEISFSISGAEQSGTNVNITSTMKSYYYTAAGFSVMSHSLDVGTTWTGSKTSSEFQFESDLENIELVPRNKTVKIVWSAANDLNATSSYTNVLVGLKFRESGSAVYTELKSGSISSIDFRPTTIIPLLRPYPDDPNFEIEFKTLENDYRVKTHFQVEVDTLPTYDGSDYQLHDSENSQIGWQVSGAAFPVNGCFTETSSLGTLDVTLITGSLTSASDGKWYVRVSRSLFIV